jgi:uncharacterized protein (TIGR00299 family) protein
MTRIAELDLVCGASGDMLLGALIDCGVEVPVLQRAIDALGIGNVRLRAERVLKSGISACKAHVLAPEEHVHRHLADIERLLHASRLTPALVEKAVSVFRQLAAAEARVHSIPVERVHFHEVGALDAIADIVGVIAGIDALGLTALHCRAVPISHGTVRCAHGVLPVPAPAVGYLIEGIPTVPLDVNGETVTPTAAALLREVVTHWTAAPSMTFVRQGFGAGTKDFERPNVLRLMIGDVAVMSGEREDTLVLLSTNIDDMNPEWLPPLIEHLLASGARDAWLTPILMKKGRPAHTLSVLCDASHAQALRHTIYLRSSSLGIREEIVQRFSVPRTIVRVTTQWGEIGIKVAELPGGASRAAPEFGDCTHAAEQHGVPLADVYEAALAAWRDRRKAP